AGAGDAVRMTRVWHFDDDGFDHRQIQTGGHTVVEEAGVQHASFLVIDVFLVQSPANALNDAALHLPFDVARVDRLARILHGRVSQDGDLAGIRVDLNVGDVNAKSAAGLLWRHGDTSANVNASMGQCLGQFRQTDPLGAVCLIAAFSAPRASYLGDLLFLGVHKHAILK